jgi:hypothetical protein
VRTTLRNWRMLRQEEDGTVRKLPGRAMVRMMIVWCIEFDKMMHTVRAGDRQESEQSQHHTQGTETSAGPLALTQAVEGTQSGPGHTGP